MPASGGRVSSGLINVLGPVRYCGVILRAAWLCAWCGGRPPPGSRHVDHVTPRCEGGADSLDNLVLSCAGCNLDRRFAEVPERALRYRTHRQVWRAVLAQLDIPLVRGTLLYAQSLGLARRLYPAHFERNRRARAAWLERQATEFPFGAAA